MSVKYHCSHLADPHAPLPPSYASSSSSHYPLSSLFFCEECDAVRCDSCVAVEVAGYFCPSCLFDVPSANVRADRNRCARSCFSCPLCLTLLQTVADDSQQAMRAAEIGASGSAAQASSYVLQCPSCKWSSREVGWNFEKPTSLALQLQRMDTCSESIQAEFDALKDHLEPYISAPSSSSSSKPVPSGKSSSRNPTRHISHLTQMAARALHRDVPGLIAAGVTGSSFSGANGARPRPPHAGGDHEGWDELGEYAVKGSWKARGLEKGLEDVEAIRKIEWAGAGGIARLERTWTSSWDQDRRAECITPQRIPLQTKLTKRCPHPTCRHLLIQPDTKTTRMKIKMVAANYLPAVEVGRRRRRITSGDTGSNGQGAGMTPEEMDRRRRERRRTRGAAAQEEDEEMGVPIKPGEVYTFQLALTNPLYDPIQIRLSQPHVPRSAPPPSYLVHIPTPHFTVNPLKDAWAYEDEEEDDGPEFEATTEATSEEGGSTLGRRARMSLLGPASGGSSMRDKEREREKRRHGDVEKKGNVSKVGLELEVLSGAVGRLQVDLEIRYTYRADEPVQSRTEEKRAREEYKTFTYWVRLDLGKVE